MSEPKKTTETLVRNEMDRYLAGLEDDHPTIRAIRLEIADMRQRIATLEGEVYCQREVIDKLGKERKHANKAFDTIMDLRNMGAIGYKVQQHREYAEQISD